MIASICINACAKHKNFRHNLKLHGIVKCVQRNMLFFDGSRKLLEKSRDCQVGELHLSFSSTFILSPVFCRTTFSLLFSMTAKKGAYTQNWHRCLQTLSNMNRIKLQYGHISTDAAPGCAGTCGGIDKEAHENALNKWTILQMKIVCM